MNTPFILKGLKRMTIPQKITHILERDFNATSPESAVKMRSVIERAIELGIAPEFPKKITNHKWFEYASVMVGAGSKRRVNCNEKKYLHRRLEKNHFLYWVDYKQDHIDLGRSQAFQDTLKTTEFGSAREVKESLDVKKEKMVANPGKYRLVCGKLISEEWIKKNPEKFKVMYGLNP